MQDNNIIKEVKKFVEDECKRKTNPYKMRAYYNHFIPMVNFAKELAKKRKANIEIVEIAAWLHDMGSIKGNYESHHITSAKIAEELLNKYHYPHEKIEQIKHCIFAHRGSLAIKCNSLEAECIKDADAMAHFNSIHSLFYLSFEVKKLEEDDAKKYVKEKLKHSWNKLSNDAKQIIKPKYDAAMLLLGE